MQPAHIMDQDHELGWQTQRYGFPRVANLDSSYSVGLSAVNPTLYAAGSLAYSEFSY